MSCSPVSSLATCLLQGQVGHALTIHTLRHALTKLGAGYGQLVNTGHTDRPTWSIRRGSPVPPHQDGWYKISSTPMRTHLGCSEAVSSLIPCRQLGTEIFPDPALWRPFFIARFQNDRQDRILEIQ